MNDIITGLIILAVILYLIYIYCRGGVNMHHPDLTGKIIVITGANRGIGAETLKALAKLNATIITASRHEEAQLRQNMLLSQSTKNKNIEFVKCDLMDLNSVKKASKYIEEKYGKIDVLITNAGIMASPYELSRQNVDSQMATNHIGHAALINYLIPLMDKSEDPRVVAVSSVCHKWTKVNDISLFMSKENYKPVLRYFETKLAIGMFIKQLSKEYPKIKCVHLHPGISYTHLWKDWHPWLMWIVSPFYKIFWKNEAEACQTALHCSFAPDVETGCYYADCKKQKHHVLIDDDQKCRKVYNDTLEFIKKNTN